MKNMIFVLLINISWTLWPFILNKYNVPNPWGMVSIMLLGIVPFLFVEWPSLANRQDFWPIIFACLGAAALNAFGAYLYPHLFNSDNATIYIGSIY